mgnify:CR=1 FL=1
MSNRALDVTACILSLNRPEYLRDAVVSVLSQTHASKDIVILDNGSESDVFTAVEEYLKKGVRWQGANVTRSAFWNFRRASALTKTKYVFIMHDDDRLCQNFLDKQIDFLERNPDVAAVSCNGYVIDEGGKRNGRLLLPDLNDSRFELYKCSADVALRYASDSCIPMSPVVYRTEILSQVDFREEFEKVADAVFFCDMADIGIVAYQSSALYECRVHGGQDSSYFSPAIMGKLENYFWTRKTKSDEDLAKLHNLLIRQHTFRNLRRLIGALRNPQSLRHVLSEFGNVWDGVFSPLAVFKIVTNAVGKRISAIWKKSSNSLCRLN